jgi:hypothetical protein
VAEQLGQAELVITVNDADALRKLGELKKQVADLEGQAGRQTTKTRTATAKASPAEVAQKRAERAAEQAANKRVSIQNRLNLLEAKGVEVTAFRLRAAKANEAAEQSQFDNARRINAQLSRALSIEENRLRVSAAQAAQLKRQEAATKGTASTVTKTAQKPTGVGFATTPEQILASRGGIQKGAASGITAREAATDKLTRLQNRLNILDAKGVNITNQRAALDQILQANKAGQLGTSQQLIRSLSRQLDIEENNLKVTNLRAAADKRRATAAANAAKAAKSGQLTPAADGIPAFIPLPKPSREERRRAQEAARRRNDILSNALIGGAFPALFGQGLGASLGGAAGGAAGGAIGGQFGFGLSLVGTALGAQVDVAIQKFRDLAKALDDPIKNFELLVQNASLSSKEVEKYAQALINSGRNAEAAAVIQSDLINTFGSAQGAKEYSSAIDTLNRSWSQATTVLAGFVAGPLAALIRQLQQPTGGAAIGLSFEQLAGQLTPEQYRQVQTRREQATEASRLSRGGLSALLPPSNEDVNAGLKAGIALAKELLGIERQRAEIAARIAAAQVLNTKALSTSYELINASVQGYTLQALQKQREVALNERNIALLQLTPEQRRGPEGQKIQQDTALKVYELDVQINDLRKERVALAIEEAAKYQLAAEKVSQELKAVQALAALSQNAQRTAQFAVQQSTLSTIQGIEASVGDAQRREREIGAQIDAARLRGGDAGEQEAARLVNEQKLAAQQTRLELEEGGKALREAGIKLREDVEAAFLSLQRLRTGDGGLNQFLTPQDRVNQERRTFEQLLPRFREAQGQFRQLRGVDYAPEFTGTQTGVNQAILSFIDAVKAEQQAVDNSIDTQRALNINTEALAKNTADLAAKVTDLIGKNWAVNVQVNGAGSSQISGDVLPATL